MCMRFCYLENTLDEDGGVNIAVTDSIRTGWMKLRVFVISDRAPPLEMKGRGYVSCVRISMIYGSDT